MAQNFDFEQSLYQNYDFFREQSLETRRFKHSDIMKLINNLNTKKLFSINKVGESIEGRDLNLITLGYGETKIFLWSQMHGDEPTATAALFDIFNFFSDTTHYREIKKEILARTKIYFLPMVNPDGAELFQRRNIFNIDLNRDAVRLQTPEAKILKNVFDSIKADFGFNLHDQNHRYTAGNNFKSATISFLAPAMSDAKEINDVRNHSIQLISLLTKMLNGFIPGHIAKYSDDYEPRAFGDNFQKWGTSTVLVESGGWQNDTEKQFIRKLNFILLLSSFKNIAEGNYRNYDSSVYDELPFNDEKLFDVLLRNLTYYKENQEIKIDVGINFEESTLSDGKTFYKKATIEDLGDLSIYCGYTDMDLKGYSIETSKTFEGKVFSNSELKDLNLRELYEKGYTNIRVKSSNSDKHFYRPINLVFNKAKQPNSNLKIGVNPNFIIKKDGKIKYLVVNGFIQNLTGDFEFKGNGLTLK